MGGCVGLAGGRAGGLDGAGVRVRPAPGWRLRWGRAGDPQKYL